MRKIIALSTLVLASSTFAQTTSTTTVKNKKESFIDKISVNWFGEAYETVVGDEEKTKDVGFYNSIGLNYQLTKRVRLVVNPRFEVNDAPGSTDDKFTELDLRFRATGNLISDDIFTALSFIPPTTQASLDADTSDGEIRFYNQKSTKFSDLDNLAYGVDLRKSFYKNTSGPTRELRVLPYVSYTNKILSEKVALRADYEGLLDHVPGKSINTLMGATGTGQRITMGADFSNVPGMNSVFPYISHYPALVKSVDQLGAGIQMFKAF